jgi:hypothetical protein
VTIGASHLRLYDKTVTTLLTILPDILECSAQEELNATGQLTATYPRTGYGADTLLATLTGYLGLWEDGVDTGLRFRYDGDSDDPSDPGLLARSLSISCPGAADALKDGIIYPQAGLNTYPWFDFHTVTPGAIGVTLLAQMHARGTLTQVTASFTSLVDSNGLAWPNTVWLRYDAGKTLLDVITDLAGRGVLDWKVRANPSGGLYLDAYVPSTYLARDRGGQWRIAQSTTTGGAYYTAAQPQLGTLTPATINLTPGANTATHAEVNLNAPLDGSYTFWLTKSAGDNAQLLVDGTALASGGSRTLTTGLHQFVVDHATGGSPGLLLVEWAGPGFARTAITTYPLAKITRGRDVIKSPRQRSRGDLKTVVLVAGDRMTNTERLNAPAVTLYDRREAYESESGVFDYGTLSLFGDRTLSRLAHPQTKYTAEWVRGQGDPEPGVDFGIGDFLRCDWVRDDTTNLFLPLRARSVVRAYDSTSGTRTCSVELNDPMIEHDVALSRAVIATNNGSVTGSTTGPIAKVGPDIVGPIAPATVTITSGTGDVYFDSNGQVRVGATISWTAVVLNTDGTAFDDLGAYYVIWRIGSQAYSAELSTRATITYLSDLAPGTVITAGVRASDASGNTSAFTYSAPTTIAVDTTPPPQPSAPQVTPVLGGLQVGWDGLDNTGTAMVPDFDHLEVHASTVAGFTPTSGTLKDSLPAPPGAYRSTLTGLLSTVDWYIRIVAVDHAGNRSVPSAVAGPYRPIAVTIPAITPADLAGIHIGGQNLLRNSSFEDSGMLDWTLAGAVRVAADPHTAGIAGVASLEVTATGVAGGAYARQVFPVVDGLPYVLTAWVRVVSGAALPVLTIRSSVGGTVKATATLASAGATYARYRLPFTADANGNWVVYLTTDAGAAGGILHYDETQIEQADVETAYAPKPDELLPNSVTTTTIAPDAVTTPKLITGAIVADKIAGNAITASKVVIGGAENAAEDPDFEDRPAYAYGTTDATGPFTTWTNMANSSVGTGTTTGGPFTIWHVGDGNGFSPEYGIAVATHPGGAAAASVNGRRVAIRPGDQFYATARVYNTADGADARIRISWRNATDTEIAVTDAPLRGTTGAWSQNEVYGVAPSSAVWARVALLNNGTTTARGYWKGVFFRRRTDSSLIVDGSILARMVDATNITAMAATINSAVITDAMIASLTVTKLVTGTLSADITVSARIKTSNTGNRVELGATGLLAYCYFTATLTSAITNSQTSIPVNVSTSTVLPAVPFVIAIDSEFLSVTARSTTSYTGAQNWTVARGILSTTDASHANAAPVIDWNGTQTVNLSTSGSVSFLGTILGGSTITGALFQTAVPNTGSECIVVSSNPGNAILFYPSVAMAGPALPASVRVATNFTTAFGQLFTFSSGRGSSTAGTGGQESFLTVAPGYGGAAGFSLQAPTSFGEIIAGGDVLITAGTDPSPSETGGSIFLTTPASPGGVTVQGGDLRVTNGSMFFQSGLNSANGIAGFERRRFTISWSASTTADVTCTYIGYFTGRPVTATQMDDGANSGAPDAYVWGRAAGATSIILRGTKAAAATVSSQLGIIATV